jgi:hypothetical protein
MKRGFKMKGFSAFTKQSPMKNNKTRSVAEVGDDGHPSAINSTPDPYQPAMIGTDRETQFDTNRRQQKIRGITYVPDIKGELWGAREYDFEPDQFHKMMNTRLPKDHPDYDYLRYFKLKHGPSYNIHKGNIRHGNRGLKIKVGGWKQDTNPARRNTNREVTYARNADPYSTISYYRDGEIDTSRYGDAAHGPHYSRIEGLEDVMKDRGYQGFLERSLEKLTTPRLKPISTEKSMSDYLASRPQPTLPPLPPPPGTTPKEGPVAENKQPIKNARITTDESGRTIVTPTDKRVPTKYMPKRGTATVERQ